MGVEPSDGGYSLYFPVSSIGEESDMRRNMLTHMTTRRRTLLAVGCVVLLTAACDIDPGFLSSAGNPSLTTIGHDNPTVMGTSLVWSENWRYHDANPLDLTRPSAHGQ